jgi:hypothetical protein
MDTSQTANRMPRTEVRNASEGAKLRLVFLLGDQAPGPKEMFVDRDHGDRARSTWGRLTGCTYRALFRDVGWE